MGDVMKLSGYIQQFLNAKATKSPKTIISYEGTLRLLAQHTGDEWPLTPDHIDSYLADCVRRGLSPSTVDKYWRETRAFCNWLHRRGKINPNPIKLAEKPPRPRPLPRVPKDADIYAVFNYLKAQRGQNRAPGHNGDKWIVYRDLAVFTLLFEAGLRNGEICQLELDDLDLTRRAVYLRKTKTNFDGTSYFSEIAAGYLADWLEQRRRLPLPPGLNTVFVSKPNHGGDFRFFTVSGVGILLQRACRRAGLDRHFTPHQLRHACAAHSFRRGAEFEDVRKQLRHRSPEMTLRYLMIDDTGRSQRQASFSPLANLS